MSFVEENDSVMIQNDRIEIEVPVPRLLKGIQGFGLDAELFDEELYAIRHKHMTITNLIGGYIRRNLKFMIVDHKTGIGQIMECDGRVTKPTKTTFRLKKDLLETGGVKIEPTEVRKKIKEYLRERERKERKWA